MTRAQARRRRKRRRRIQRAAAWTLIYAFEILLAAAPTALLAELLLPAVMQQRGYFAIGGEWLLLAIIFCVAYQKIHNAVCDRIFGEDE